MLLSWAVCAGCRIAGLGSMQRPVAVPALSAAVGPPRPLRGSHGHAAGQPAGRQEPYKASAPRRPGPGFQGSARAGRAGGAPVDGGLARWGGGPGGGESGGWVPRAGGVRAELVARIAAAETRLAELSAMLAAPGGEGA